MELWKLTKSGPAQTKYDDLDYWIISVQIRGKAGGKDLFSVKGGVGFGFS